MILMRYSIFEARYYENRSVWRRYSQLSLYAFISFYTEQNHRCKCKQTTCYR